MNAILRRATMAVFLASAAAMTLGLPAATYAADKAPKGQVMRKEVGAPFNDAVKAFQAKDFATAKAKADQADMVPMKTPYEDYQVAKLLSAIALNQPMPDYATAAAMYERMIASGGVPDMDKGAMYSTIMKLHYQEMQYPKVIADAAELQKLEPLDDTGYLILAQSYYNANDFANTVATIKAANAAKVAAGGMPSEPLLRMQLACEQKLKDDAGYRQTLDQLAMVSTQPDVWTQEIDQVLTAPGITDHQVLNLYRLSFLLGTMRDIDYKSMATIDLKNGLPSEAKAALTKGAVTGELMTQTDMFLSKDQGVLTALAAEAPKQKNGEIDVKLGESYLTYGRNDEAVAAMQKGIDKGGVQDPTDAQTTLGIALFKAGKKDEAQAVFDKAAMGTTSAAAVAHVWALYTRHPAV